MNQKQLQTKKIEQVLDIVKRYDSVVGAYLYGSVVKDENTSFSDIDLVIIFENESKEDIKKIFDQVKATERTLSTLYQLYDHESLILFESGVRLDLTMIDIQRFETWSLEGDKAKILMDRKGVIAKVVASSKKGAYEHPKWNEHEGDYVDWYFWMFRQAYCYTLQSKLVEHKALDKLKDAQASIHSIRTKLLETLYFTNGSKQYLSAFDSEIQNLVKQSYASLEVDQILLAIKSLTKLYEIIIEPYCIKESKNFPREKYERMWELYDVFDGELEKYKSSS